jgi:hypothetical protein
MTKPISSYPKREQAAVISRRLASNSGGLGYLAAKDAVDPKLVAERSKKKGIVVDDE